MAYTAPRGPCSQKLSMLTSCPCYRFMIHPMKASTSFDCDGCGHHASYHRMQNEQEEEIAKRWKEEEEAKARQVESERWRSVEEVMEELAPKRKRIAAAAAPPSPGETESEIVELFEEKREERSVNGERPMVRAGVSGVGRKRRRG